MHVIHVPLVLGTEIVFLFFFFFALNESPCNTATITMSDFTPLSSPIPLSLFFLFFPFSSFPSLETKRQTQTPDFRELYTLQITGYKSHKGRESLSIRGRGTTGGWINREKRVYCFRSNGDPFDNFKRARKLSGYYRWFADYLIVIYMRAYAPPLLSLSMNYIRRLNINENENSSVTGFFEWLLNLFCNSP